MSRFVIVDPFIRSYPISGRGSQMSARQVATYLRLLANQPETRRYASLAFNHFTCGRYNQANAALAKIGILFYRVGGEVEKRRGASGYQIRKLPNRPGTRSEHRMGSENPQFVRTPQGTFPLNDAARNQTDPGHPQLMQGQRSKPCKPWWRFW